MSHSDLAAQFPETAARVVITAHREGGDLLNAWEVFAAGVGPTAALRYVQAQEGGQAAIDAVFAAMADRIDELTA